MRKTKMLLAIGALSALVAGFVTPAAAEGRFSFGINLGEPVGPPPTLIDNCGARSGYVLEPGYYTYNGGMYSYNQCRYILERPGFTYSPHRWIEQDGHRRLEGGEWRHNERNFRGDEDRRSSDGRDHEDHKW